MQGGVAGPAGHWSLLGALLIWVTACANSVSLAPGLAAAELSQVPATTYRLGPNNADISFSVRPFGMGEVVGVFEDFTADLTILDPVVGSAELTAEVNVDSVSVPRAFIEEMVRGPNWFSVAEFPFARFSGAVAGWSDDGTGALMGPMTIRDVTMDETFTFRLTCDSVTACPSDQLGFEGNIVLDRRTYGMGSLSGLVGNDVILTVSGTIDVAIPDPVDKDGQN